MTVLEGPKEQQASESAPPAIELVDISKRFTGVKHVFERTIVSTEKILSPERTYRPMGFVRSLIVGRRWETVALDKVSFSVEHGEVFGLLGPNGSGKTTLIKILANLVLPDSGTVFVDGINVVRKPYATASRLQTVLSESIGLEKRVTARQNLMLFASLYSLPKAEAEERIDYLLDYFGLSNVADKMSQAFSTGMTRKLSVCRVLLSNASIIVFDEPTSGLDPAAADDFRHLILEDLVKRQKKTILMATHNLAEARAMCTRIALLNEGSLLAIGTPEEIRKSVEDRVDVSITLATGDRPLDGLQGELEKVDGVSSVVIIDMHWFKQLKISGRKDLDYLRVLTLLSARELKVQSLETNSPSLEDAFFRLTRGERK